MGRRIESLHVFLVENDQGDEGVAALPNPVAHRTEPMIATSQEKLEALSLAASAIVRRSGQRMRLVHFIRRVDLGDIVPSEADDGPV